jgi:hypothetical protein
MDIEPNASIHCECMRESIVYNKGAGDMIRSKGRADFLRKFARRSA